MSSSPNMFQAIKKAKLSMHTNLRILFEDSYLVVVDKDSNVLSVPGKPASASVDKPFKPRYLEWKDTLFSVYNSGRLDEHSNRVLGNLIQSDSLPRTKEKFLSALQKITKETDKSVHHTIWTEIEKTDFNLNRKSSSLSKEENEISVAEMLEDKYCHRIYHVHRLDQETSGVVLFAKTAIAAGDLCKQFRDRLVHKKYKAKVFGLVSKDLTRIELPIRADLTNRPFQVVDHIDGKESLTLVTNIQHIPAISNTEASYSIATPSSDLLATISSSSSSEDSSDRSKNHSVSSSSSSSLIRMSDCHVDSSILELEPMTGRTHQLRLHLSAICHPIFGDTLYAPPDVMMATPHLCLHACSISFTHPITKESMTVSSSSSSSDVASSSSDVASPSSSSSSDVASPSSSSDVAASSSSHNFS